MGRILLLFLVITASASAATEREWFSDRPREVPPLLADSREAAVRVGYLFADTGKRFFDFALGGHAGLLRADTPDGSLSLSVRGLAASRFQYHSVSFDLQNTDFIGGAAIAYRQEAWAGEIFFFHQSSHFGDDVAVQGKGAPNFSMEGFRLLASHTFSEWRLRLYGGSEFLLRSDPSELRFKPMFIVGADWLFIPGNANWVTAADIRWRDGRPIGVTYLVGYELGDPAKVMRRQRLFAEFYAGPSRMGQFSHLSELYFLVGMAMNP